MKSCEDIRVELAGMVMSGEPAMPEVETHLAGCTACRAEKVALQRLDGLLVRYARPVSVSPTLASTFANRLAAEAVAEPGFWAAFTAGGFRWLVPATAAGLVALLWMTGGPPGPRVAGDVSIEEPKVVAVAPEAPEDEVAATGQDGIVPVGAGVGIVDVPEEVRQEAGMFVDFAVIEDLEVLELLEGNPTTG